MFRCLLLLFCIAVISAQKGGRKTSASDISSVQRASPVQAARKGIPFTPDYQQQVQEPDRDPDENVDVGSQLRPRPPPPPVDSDGDGIPEVHAAPEPYSFSYNVEDPESGAASTRQETQDANGEIVGFYHIRDQDGRTRRVDYTAGKDGFKATIKSNEEGLSARPPADVKLELSSAPSERVNRFAVNSNNRPLASETSIKSLGRPAPNKFFQNLIPSTTTTRLPPPPPPPPQQFPEETQDVSQLTQQYQDDEEEPPVVASRDFESIKSAAQPVQQIQVLSRPRPQQVYVRQTTTTTLEPSPTPIRPTPRPIGIYTPIREQTYREQAPVNLQPIQTPIVYQEQAQYEEDVPINQVQEIIEVRPQPLPSPPPPPPPPQPSFPKPSILIPSQPVIRFPQPVKSAQQPQPSLTRPPQPLRPIIKYTQTLRPIKTSRIPTLPTTVNPPPPPEPVQITVQPPTASPPQESLTSVTLTPASPPPPPPPVKTAQQQQSIQYISPSGQLISLPPLQATIENLPILPQNNGFFITQQHREPITQQQLLDLFQPYQQISQQQLQQLIPIKTTQQTPLVLEAPEQRPINLVSTHGGNQPGYMTYLPQEKPQLGNAYQFVVHREQDTYQLPPLSIQQIQQAVQQQVEPQQVVQQQPQQQEIVSEQQPQPQIASEDVVFQQEKDNEEPQVIDAPSEPSEPVEQTKEEQIKFTLASQVPRPLPPQPSQATLVVQPQPSPLPPPEPIQQVAETVQPQQQLFEPQVYEPLTQQSYDPPIQQLYETSQQVVENVVNPPVQPEKCTCPQQAAEQTQLSYGLKTAQSAPEQTNQLKSAPYISPASNINLFLPQAFRSRRGSNIQLFNSGDNSRHFRSYLVEPQQSQLNSEPISGESIDKV